ncbi:MAG: cysteine desulfurase family protein [Syntrophomonas sp.]
MIYVDNAATTKIDSDVLAGMMPYLCENYGNASSIYSFGQQARKAIGIARNQLANALNVQSNEISFVSCGSEGDTWAIQGIARLIQSKGCHIITSNIEHHAVLNVCRTLEAQGYDVTYLPVDCYGMVSLKDFENAIRSDTILVSIMMANNEIGTIQPIKEIAAIAHKHGILIHTDAVQTVGHIPVDIKDLNVDLLTASAHKFHGPKGVGIVYAKQGIVLPPLICGGHQENGRRGGTENTAGIVGAGIAIQKCIDELPDVFTKLQELSSHLISRLLEKLPDIKRNGHPVERLPGIVSLSFPNMDGEALLMQLDLKGICVSTGSACNSGNLDPSHVLSAIGVPNDLATGTIRFSFGKYNTLDEIDPIVDAVCTAYKKSNRF